MPKFSDLDEITAPRGVDLFAVEEISSGLSRHITAENLAVYFANRNRVIAGLGMVAQRSAYTLVKDAYDFGLCDRFEGMATGTAVSAGTLTQSTGASVGRTGYAFHFSGVTLTGTGILYLRTRIEAKDALKLKNQSASLSVKVYHDVGSAKTFTLYIRKADSADNFAAVTEISNDGGTSVNSASATTLTFENVSMGDCSNGIEIEIKIETGAITTKNVYITEVQLEEGAAATDFGYRNYAIELSMAKRYYQRIYQAAGLAATTTFGDMALHFQEMRVAPTIGQSGVLTVTDGAANFAQSSTSISLLASKPNAGLARLSNFTGMTGQRPLTLATFTNYITLDSEL